MVLKFDTQELDGRLRMCGVCRKERQTCRSGDNMLEVSGGLRGARADVQGRATWLPDIF